LDRARSRARARRRTARPPDDAARGDREGHQREPAYVELQAQGGAEIAPCTPQEMRQIRLAEIQLYRDMMKIAGIKPE
jgi:hypothetical protein